MISCRIRNVFCFCIVALLEGCTTIGVNDPRALGKIYFGKEEVVKLCVFTDDGISDTEAIRLIADAWQEESRQYGIRFYVQQLKALPRPGFTMKGIMAALRAIPLVEPCDRNFYLVGRHLGDTFWAMTGMSEVLGAVNDETATYGYAVVQWGSMNQIFLPPSAAVRHEFYHLLGCGHSLIKTGCYKQMEALKFIKRKQEHSLDGFFPSLGLLNGRLFLSREEVNKVNKPHS